MLSTGKKSSAPFMSKLAATAPRPLNTPSLRKSRESVWLTSTNANSSNVGNKVSVNTTTTTASTAAASTLTSTRLQPTGVSTKRTWSHQKPSNVVQHSQRQETSHNSNKVDSKVNGVHSSFDKSEKAPSVVVPVPISSTVSNEPEIVDPSPVPIRVPSPEVQIPMTIETEEVVPPLLIHSSPPQSQPQPDTQAVLMSTLAQSRAAKLQQEEEERRVAQRIRAKQRLAELEAKMATASPQPEIKVRQLAEFENRSAVVTGTGDASSTAARTPRMLFDPKSGKFVEDKQPSSGNNTHDTTSPTGENKRDRRRARRAAANPVTNQGPNTTNQASNISNQTSTKPKVKKRTRPRTNGVLYARDALSGALTLADIGVQPGQMLGYGAYVTAHSSSGGGLAEVPDPSSMTYASEEDDNLLSNIWYSTRENDPNEVKLCPVNDTPESPTLQATAVPWQPTSFVLSSATDDTNHTEEVDNVETGLGFDPTSATQDLITSPEFRSRKVLGNSQNSDATSLLSHLNLDCDGGVNEPHFAILGSPSRLLDAGPPATNSFHWDAVQVQLSNHNNSATAEAADAWAVGATSFGTGVNFGVG